MRLALAACGTNCALILSSQCWAFCVACGMQRAACGLRQCGESNAVATWVNGAYARCERSVGQAETGCKPINNYQPPLQVVGGTIWATDRCCMQRGRLNFAACEVEQQAVGGSRVGAVGRGAGVCHPSTILIKKTTAAALKICSAFDNAAAF